MDRARAGLRRLLRRSERRMRAPRRPSVTLVEWGAFPDNPWQRMMAAAAARDGILVETLDHGASLDRTIEASRPGGLVVHVNWTAPISQRAERVEDALASVDAALDRIDRLHAAGGRLLWTIHNERAHELVHPGAEERLLHGLAWRADAIHLMHESATELVPSSVRHRTVVVPHPSYDGVYPASMDRAAARAALGVPDDALAVLAFGLLRPYKDITATVRGFLAARERGRRLHLLVAGQPGQGYDPAWLEPVLDREDATVHVGFVEPEDVAAWHLAADVVAMPQRTGLNSGTLLLAATFAVPVVAGASRAARAHLSEGWVTTVDASQEDWLERGIAALPPNARAKARRAADRLHPDRVGARFAALVRRTAASG